VAPADHVDQVVDVHSMPFADETFDCVVGIDVVHHFFHPARGLSEIARVLRPRGRLVLIEPWTGPVGYFVNKYLHTEECFPIVDPWAPVLTEGKRALEGNATIPKTLFFDHAHDIAAHTGLEVVALTPFSCLGFLSTGGFSRWSSPAWLGRAFMRAERTLPISAMRFLAVKVFVVAEKTTGA
jgi:SAM-dependent methyltransferase